MPGTEPAELIGQFFHPASRPDPYPLLDRLREASPFPFPADLGVVLARYEDCAAMLSDPRLSADRITRGADIRSRREVLPSFLSMDPPEHTRLRRMVAPAFSRRAVRALEPRIREITGELLAALRERDRCDVVDRLARPLPARVISELLGAAPGEVEMLQTWSDRLSRLFEPPPPVPDAAADARTQAAWTDSAHYFRALAAQRRRTPRGDVVSQLVQIQGHDDRFTEDELIVTCILLLIAGQETTVSLIANCVLALLRHPDQYDALRKDPGLAANAVEETLRFDPPVHLTNRYAREPLRIGTVEVPKDGEVSFLFGAANRDPAVFPDADRFDIRRETIGHLAFGAGPHFCLGAALARLEATVAVQAFATELVDPQLDEGGLSYAPNVTIRRPTCLSFSYAGMRDAIR